jgi:hypothetical protein
MEIRRKPRLCPVKFPQVVSCLFKLVALKEIAVANSVEQRRAHDALEASCGQKEEAEKVGIPIGGLADGDRRSRERSDENTDDPSGMSA